MLAARYFRLDRATLRDAAGAVRAWPARRWITATIAGLIAALVTGVPTGIVHTAFYTRMTPVTWWDYPVCALSAAAAGMLAATYVRAASAVRSERRAARRGVAGGLLSFFAIGCPICNKLVVAAIGVSGALNYFGPIQPALAAVGLALLAAGLLIRLGGETACASLRA